MTHPTSASDSAADPTRYAELRLHLGSEHALANWLDADDPEDIHQHEHAGPGTIRDHPEASRTYDPRRAASVALELLDA